jgi:feruloyl esterase
MSETARLFMVPGMDHCGGGPGANDFDFITALEEWVEQGRAPESLLGAHRDAAGQTAFSRPVFAYPDSARYDGNKERISPDGFKRVSPRRE